MIQNKHYVCIECSLHTLFTNLYELFKNHQGSVCQCDRESRLWIHFQGKSKKASLDSFRHLYQQVLKIDLKEMAENPSPHFDLVILLEKGLEGSYVLSLAELHAFKELLEGTRLMLELNRLLEDRLCSLPQ